MSYKDAGGDLESGHRVGLDYFAEELEDAIRELRVMNRRMFRRKAQKARHGERVGEPIPRGSFCR